MNGVGACGPGYPANAHALEMVVCTCGFCPFVVMAVSVRYHFESGLPRKREFKRGPTVFAGDGHVAFVEVHH